MESVVLQKNGDSKTNVGSSSSILSFGIHMIVCLYGVLRRRLQSRPAAGDSGANSFALQR